MLKHRFMQSLVAVFALAAMLCQGTWVLAGTTGGLSGVVSATDANGNVTGALAGATVAVASASQTASATTDATGHFSFVALAPDTYTVTVTKAGYDPSSLAGVNVFADQVQTINLSTHLQLKTIVRINARANSGLVRSGTTGDIYSVSATQQDKIATAGGGGTLNSAWSALATVPGVFVTPGQSGYIGAGPSVSIRGGDYDQIGYEIDGVPVNRSFDNYPSGPASSLGQQELQVYTGVPPANAQSNGLSGFINQVIRTGTYPGFANADIGIGGPTYYHKASFEVGGATPNRNFSYYVGIGGYNQDFRYVDNFNGASINNLFGPTLAPCSAGSDPTLEASCFAPGGANYSFDPLHPNPLLPNGMKDPHYNDTTSFFLGPDQTFATSNVMDRDNVVNLHFGLPHKNGTKDDIQLLGLVNHIETDYYSSTNDMGGLANLGNTDLGVPGYLDGYAYNGPTGTFLPTNYQAKTSPYYFPNVPTHAFSAGANAFGAAIPADERDGFENDQAIYKVQYTHNMGSNALLKLYGYSYYSDWLNTGPQTNYADYIGSVSPDYELSSHSRGLSLSFVDQINPQNLINFTGSYTTANSTRDNNTQFVNGAYGSASQNARTQFAVLVDSNNPTSGICYAADGTPASCFPNQGAQTATLRQAYQGTIAPITATTCGTGACQYYVVENGQYATYNQVKPNFYSASITDDFHPTSKLTINAGLRYDNFQFNDSDTSGTGARTLFYNAYAQDYCADSNNSNFTSKAALGIGIATPCSTLTGANGLALRAPGISNPGGNQSQDYSVYQPRIGFTYSFSPRTVIRGSYGRYGQAPNTAFEQYNALQQDAPALLYNTYGFENFGFTSPNHSVRPEISNNYDFSIEHQFAGDVAIKVTPFLRKTQDEIQQFYLNQQTNFVSGLNVGRQTSEGVEFELDKGSFDRQGVSARLTFAYTNNYINYTTLENGSTVISPINASIAQYNAYTSACAAGGHLAGTASCGTTSSGAAASPCYTTAGAADPTCAAGSIANPYWNASPQGLLNPNDNFKTFDILTQGIGSAVDAYGAPYTASFVLNERAGKFSVAPILQFFGGQRYGAPETTEGIAPDTCGTANGVGVTGDSRYPYGAPGGLGYDASSCGLLAAIPNRYTGAFDGIGAFVEPSQLQLHAQMTYDVSKNATLVANFSNIMSRCFGGSTVAWSVPGACTYGVLAGGTTGDIGNNYNEGAVLQPYARRPYLPSFISTFPFNVFVNAKIKI